MARDRRARWGGPGFLPKVARRTWIAGVTTDVQPRSGMMSVVGLAKRRKLGSRIASPNEVVRRCAARTVGRMFEALEARQMLAGNTPVISEFMAVNGDTLADQDGAYSDWIEIHNPTGASVNLDGY